MSSNIIYGKNHENFLYPLYNGLNSVKVEKYWEIFALFVSLLKSLLEFFFEPITVFLKEILKFFRKNGTRISQTTVCRWTRKNVFS